MTTRANWTPKVGDEVMASYTVPQMDYETGQQYRAPGEHDGELGIIKEVIGATPTYRVGFGHGRDAFLCMNSLEPRPLNAG